MLSGLAFNDKSLLNRKSDFEVFLGVSWVMKPNPGDEMWMDRAEVFFSCFDSWIPRMPMKMQMNIELECLFVEERYLF